MSGFLSGIANSLSLRWIVGSTKSGLTEGRGEMELRPCSGTSKEGAFFLVRYCFLGGSLPQNVLLLVNLKAALLADAREVEVRGEGGRNCLGLVGSCGECG